MEQRYHEHADHFIHLQDFSLKTVMPITLTLSMLNKEQQKFVHATNCLFFFRHLLLASLLPLN